MTPPLKVALTVTKINKVYTYAIVLRSWRRGGWHSERFLYGAEMGEQEFRDRFWSLIAKVLELDEIARTSPAERRLDAIQDALPDC